MRPNDRSDITLACDGLTSPAGGPTVPPSGRAFERVILWPQRKPGGGCTSGLRDSPRSAAAIRRETPKTLDSRIPQTGHKSPENSGGAALGYIHTSTLPKAIQRSPLDCFRKR